jgi:L-cysteate sulfo-lyase
MDIETLKRKMEMFPRCRFVHLPTPLHRLENITRELGGPEIWMKRDDLTGFGFGGNKSRKLEFIIADAMDKKADVIVTWAGLQSNWCMQTAAAARRFGLRPILLLFKRGDSGLDYDGNLLLDYLLEAEIRIREAEKGKVISQEYAAEFLEEIVNEVKEWGHTPYVVSVGGSQPGLSMDQPLGALSYVLAFAEMVEQAESAGVSITHVVHATGSGATQAGLVVGVKAMNSDIRVVGVSVSDEKEVFIPIVLDIARATERALGIGPAIERHDIIVLDEYIGEGYGIVNAEVAGAVRSLLAREGVVLDPVYTGKAMAALFDLVQKGQFRKEDKIVFFHTGGTPALFPYRGDIIEKLGLNVDR